ncbi:MAG TPA: DUF5666 domain-containing protein [Terriglobales bacterium]|nr:DUF5666 domain-containing protein [Terriglobales bacterium]
MADIGFGGAKSGLRAAILFAGATAVGLCVWALRAAGQEGTGKAAGAFSRVVGTIKAIEGNSITLASDEGGATLYVTVRDTTRLLRVAPGEKDLKNAQPANLADLQAGDRILVRGRPSDDPHALEATAIVVMKQTDVVAAREREREDWQKRGVGGLVTAVDQVSGTITLSVGALGAKRTVTVHTTKNTILRRYAPASPKFDDAQPAPLDQIKPGDQLRARGTRSADGSEIAAEEVVSGTFRNIAGTVTQVDATDNRLTVQDAISKKPVVVRFSSESQLRKLSEEFAQRIALRLKGSESSGEGSAAGNGSEGSQSQASAGGGAGRAPDWQQILARIPASSLRDLQKGDVVMLVSTQGSDSAEVTAITVLAGVDAILRASPNGASSMLLSPWSLGSPSLEGASP